MALRRVIGWICFGLILSLFPTPSPAEDFTNAISAFLQRRVEIEKRDVGIVIGIVDEHGSSVVSCGKMDNGTPEEVNGDTLFDIASITKPFTGLLLQAMIERGEMKLTDPVQKYLPPSVRMPTRNGKEITLLHLATHTSGLPHIAGNLNPKRPDQPFAHYTVDELNSFLSSYELTHDPGAKFAYSSLGTGLLGHIIGLKAGSDYESLVVDRICRPLKMDSTRITLTPELKARFATGHNQFGEQVPSWERQTQLGGSALRSTANDLLKFLSANFGLTRTSLTPVMEKTHALYLDQTLGVDMGLLWLITRGPQGRKIIWHAGGGPGYVTFAGFDKGRRRGVVVLSSSFDVDAGFAIGMLLLASEWHSDSRPKETKISNEHYDSFVGQYRLSPDFALGQFTLRLLLPHVPKAIVYIPMALCLAVVLFLVWRAATVRKRCIILGGAGLASGLLAVVILLGASYTVCALASPIMGIRREGDRLFLQYDIQFSPLAARFLPSGVVPHITGELLPQSESRLFERMTGMPITVSRNDRREVSRLTAHFLGASFCHKRIADQPPKAYEPPKPRVTIKLDTNVLDACVGHYHFPPTAAFPTGIKATIRREGDQLLWEARGMSVVPGPFNVYAQSETNFFIKVHAAQLTFLKNDKGEVTAVSLRNDAWLPDSVGKKLPNE